LGKAAFDGAELPQGKVHWLTCPSVKLNFHNAVKGMKANSKLALLKY
jgi:hypothetical protein